MGVALGGPAGEMKSRQRREQHVSLCWQDLACVPHATAVCQIYHGRQRMAFGWLACILSAAAAAAAAAAACRMPHATCCVAASYAS